LELGTIQSEAARRLGISTVTLSRWECDKVYPTWNHQPDLIAYLGYDPFPSCGLRDPHGNEPLGVAFLSTGTLGDRIRTRRLELKLTAKECAQKLKVDAKTLHGWENNRHQPSAGAKTRIIAFLGYDPLQSNATTLGEKIKQYRIQRGLSLRKLAKELGVDPGTLARREVGESELCGKLKKRINSFLNILAG